MHTRVVLRAQTPLTFRVGRDAARAETLGYVPGSALLGGLADACRLNGGADEFAAWFLEGNILFSNLYPAMFASAALQDDDAPVLPIPLTARTCKRFPGFCFDIQTEGDRRHGVTDALIPLTLFALSGEQRTDVLAHLKDCPVCDEPLDRLSGFFRRGQQVTEVGQAEVRLAIRTRSGINYTTGAALQGILYSREVLPEGATFWGRWRIADSVAASFQAFVEKAVADDAGWLRLGNNRTRGLGRVTLNLSEQGDADSEVLRQRVLAFDVALRQAAKAARVDTPAKLYVPLTLTSDAILYDRLLRPQLQITGDYLRETWGLTGAQVVHHTAGVRRVEGWSSLWGLPKADDLAMAMGSVFVVALPTVDAETFARLQTLQAQGIGARRTEGFGMLRVAEAFHFEHLQVEGGYR